MSEHPIVLPDYLTPPQKRGRSRLKMIVVTLISLFVVAALVAAYLWVEYLTYTEAAENSLGEGRIVVGAHTDLHDVSDPLPADVSEEDYAAFWAEPALNTPDALALLDLINMAWKAQLQEDLEYDYSTLALIGDRAQRANAKAALDELTGFLSNGTVQAAKRVVYEDLAHLARPTCHRSDLVDVMYEDDGHPIRNWITTDTQVLSLQAIGDQEAEATALVGKVYPDAFEAALPHFCKFPRPPESSHPGDMELLDSVTHEADLLLNSLRARPNSGGQLPEDDYEAFWNSPVMTSPEVRAYLDRLGERAVSNYRGQAAYFQGDIDQIKDPAVRDYARQYFEWVVNDAAKDNGRRLAVGEVYEDLEMYWKATCTDLPDRWQHSSPIKRNIWNSDLEPDFSESYVGSARIAGSAWDEAAYDLAMEFYPEAYAAGLDYYCK